jgi:poly-gamma-glutamate capsule biosynthesis protein CapA/YwtB (metallophosphatase superfamily)
MKKKIVLALTLILTVSFTFFIYSYQTSKNLETRDKLDRASAIANFEDSTISLFFVGDLMGHQPMISSAKIVDSNKYEYTHWFQYITPIIEEYDFAIGNLEVALGGEPYTGYPQFSSPDSYAEGAKKSGFDFLITANNHSLDRGKKGLERTIDVLDQLKIEHTGTFKNEKERNDNYPYIKILKSKKIAILNYTYGTNGLKVELPNIVNAIDTIQIREDIKKAKALKSDFILVTIHWGSEYQRNYNDFQSNLAQWLCDEGADAIIGMHPHVVQPMEIMHPKNNKSKNIPIAYSLGNFVSNQRDQYKNGGIAVGLELKIKNNKLSFDNWSYLPFWVRLGGKPKGYYIIPVSEWEKNPGKFELNSSEEQQIKQFADDTRTLLLGSKEMK